MLFRSAIVCSNGHGEIPVNFKAAQDGEYTITVNPEDVEMNYLHLIDNLTGADVDLLALNGGDATHCVSTYTFTGKTTDYESRFKLVFDARQGGADADGDFAFISNGEIIINGCNSNATLQVVDMLGRIVIQRRDGACIISTDALVPGAYVLRLVDGGEIRNQKLIIK